MPTLNLSRVVTNPRFAQVAEIMRSTGSWVAGVWTETDAPVSFYGIIKPADPETLEMMPEGDRVTGAITLHTVQPLYETHTTGPTDPAQGTSDVLQWNGQNWRIMKVWPWQDFGYVKAYAVRMSGQ